MRKSQLCLPKIELVPLFPLAIHSHSQFLGVTQKTCSCQGKPFPHGCGYGKAPNAVFVFFMLCTTKSSKYLKFGHPPPTPVGSIYSDFFWLQGAKNKNVENLIMKWWGLPPESSLTPFGEVLSMQQVQAQLAS